MRKLLAAAALGALSARPTVASALWTFERARAALTAASQDEGSLAGAPRR